MLPVRRAARPSTWWACRTPPCGRPGSGSGRRSRTAAPGSPVSRITVNLAPAGQRKEGTVYDLPILLGLLAACGGAAAACRRTPPFWGSCASPAPCGRWRGCCPWPCAPPGRRHPQAVCPGRKTPPRPRWPTVLTVYPVETCRPAAGASPGRDAPSRPAEPVAAHRRDAAHAGLCRGHGTGEREACAGDRRRRRPQRAAGRLPRRRASPCWPGGCPPSCRI